MADGMPHMRWDSDFGAARAHRAGLPAVPLPRFGGGGASAVLLHIHLLHHNVGGCHVTILERRATLGAGIAYATNHPDHLLNVRASNRSAFPDDPDHFVRSLRAQGKSEATKVYDVDSFAPRHLYRDYLASLLAPLTARGQLRHVRDEVVAVHQTLAGSAAAASR